MTTDNKEVLMNEAVDNVEEVTVKDAVDNVEEITMKEAMENIDESVVNIDVEDGVDIWDKLQGILDQNKTFEITINEIVKGGATADVEGIRAFIPASQMSSSYIENLQDFKGRTMDVKIIELEKENKKLVLSRKVIEKEENEAKGNLVWDELKKGDLRKGVVTRLAKFGAFVDLGGVDGLIHISELSWKRVQDPSEVVSVGQELEVHVLDLDREKGRISLGLKEAKGNPWNNISSTYHINDIVEGTVVRIMDFGAFVQLPSGIDGLVHLSEISEDRIEKVSDVLKVGDVVKVKIGDINEKDRRISLSIKEALDKSYGDLSEYNNDGQGLTLGDLFKNKFKDFKF
ncbi:30S ribosomal protein S1 [Clostridium sp.]